MLHQMVSLYNLFGAIMLHTVTYSKISCRHIVSSLQLFLTITCGFYLLNVMRDSICVGESRVYKNWILQSECTAYMLQINVPIKWKRLILFLPMSGSRRICSWTRISFYLDANQTQWTSTVGAEEKESVHRPKFNAVIFTGHVWMHNNLVT